MRLRQEAGGQPVLPRPASANRRKPKRAAAILRLRTRRPPEGIASGGVGLGALRSGASLSIGAMKRYPRVGRVSTNRGDAAESPRTSRILVIALFRPVSKSTKVSDCQSFGAIRRASPVRPVVRGAKPARTRAAPGFGPSGQPSAIRLYEGRVRRLRSESSANLPPCPRVLSAAAQGMRASKSVALSPLYGNLYSTRRGSQIPYAGN